MKALSIRQPWAWLIVHGYKDIENRDWSTRVRGPVLIHAGKTLDREAYRDIQAIAPDIVLPALASLARGGIVGQCEIITCVRTSESRWFFGPYGFVIQHASPLPFRPLKGQLGFFEVDTLERP
jgi:hypothetical protein